MIAKSIVPTLFDFVLHINNINNNKKNTKMTEQSPINNPGYAPETVDLENSADLKFQPPELYLKNANFSHTHPNGVRVYKFKDSDSKNFIGGYKNKETSVEYHHAKIQTAPKKWSPSTVTLPDGTVQEVEQNSRETQTVFVKNRITQTFRDGTTQMTTPGTCYVSTANDKI